MYVKTFMPIPAKPGRPHRYDVEYHRCGVANIFMFIEQLGGWRRVSVTEHRKRLDWTEQIRILLEEDYPQAEVVVLVMDNLNTHSIGSLYEAFQPAKARELARRLEIHYTPKHGSWRNIAEIELSVLSRQCLDQRIESIERLESECHCAAASCVRDRSRPPATGLQEQVANRRKRLWLRALVVSVAEKVLLKASGVD
jgi:hypothetical protein